MQYWSGIKENKICQQIFKICQKIVIEGTEDLRT